jgi:hypothetical protein
MIRDNYDTIKDIENNVRIMGQHEGVFIGYIETRLSEVRIHVIWYCDSGQSAC